MTSVSRKDGFRYGFYAFAYWLVLLVFSAALVAAGGWIVSEQVGDIGVNQEGGLAALGGFVAVLGVLVFGSGQIGLVYKLVADGVAAGAARDRRTGTATADAASPEPADSPSESATEAPETGAPAAEGQPAERDVRPDRDGAEGHPESGSEPTPRPREGRSPGDTDGRGGHDDREDTGDQSGTEPVAGSVGGQRDGPAVPDPDEGSEGDDTAGRAEARPGGEQSAGRTGAAGSDDPSRSDPDDGADPAGTGAAGDSRAESGGWDPFSETEFDPSDGGEAATPADDGGDGAAADADTASGGSEQDGGSPADVASESGLAEELGFERTEGPDESGSTSPDAASEGTDSGVSESTDGSDGDDPLAPERGYPDAESDDVTEAETVIDADGPTDDAPSSASASEAERAKSGTDRGAGTDEDAEGGGPESAAETGSLADALAGDEFDEEDDDSVPEWTTGANHENESDR